MNSSRKRWTEAELGALRSIEVATRGTKLNLYQIAWDISRLGNQRSPEAVEKMLRKIMREKIDADCKEIARKALTPDTPAPGELPTRQLALVAAEKGDPNLKRIADALWSINGHLVPLLRQIVGRLSRENDDGHDATATRV